jgi:hypothetical protein
VPVLFDDGDTMIETLLLVWAAGVVLFGVLGSYYIWNHPLAMGLMVLLWPVMLLYMLWLAAFVAARNRYEGNS